MDRVIITGANGAGKSHLAARLGAALGLSPTCYDALKLTTGWQQRPLNDARAELAQIIATPRWLIEGGPSMLPLALPHAQAVIWLDPPLLRRAWRLFQRPLRHRGTTRPELPAGNVDQLRPQWRFGWQSLRSNRQFEVDIKKALAETSALVLRCRTAADLAAAIDRVSTSADR